MDSKTPVPSLDVSDAKPSFRKPSNDAANRKYRRHSSTDISDSSSSDGSPKHERNHNPIFSKEDRVKMDGGKRKNEDRGSDKWASASYHDYRRHDDHSRHQRTAEDERNYRRSSGSGLESRSGNRFEHGRHENYYNRSRENNNTLENYSRDKHDIYRYSKDKSDNDRYSRDKSDSGTYRSKEAIAYDRHNDRRLSSDRVVSRDRYERPYKDDMRSREQGRYRDRRVWDEKRERQMSPGDYKNDDKTFNEGLKGHAKDSRAVKDRGAIHRKETNLNSIKQVDGETEHGRAHDDKDNDKHKDKYVWCEKEEIRNEDKGQWGFHDNKHGRDERIKDKSYAVEDPSSKKHKSGRSEKPADEHDVKTIASSRQDKEDAANTSSEAVSSSNSQADATQDFDAAKIAAMKAAELVNKNLTGGSFLSTDQKKKLLWGNKKNTSTEESGNCWDLPLFTDRERQEKFNKLMSLRLPWYLWPTVGCEGRSEAGVQTRQGWQPSRREAGAAPDGLREAIHCWTAETGWQNRRSWSVMTVTILPGTPQERSSNSLFCTLLFCLMWKTPLLAVSN